MGRPLLPPDLIFEILRRLPSKSLFRFSCVCKSWRALVSLPDFRHRRRPPALLSCATVQDEEDNVTLHISTFDSDGTLTKQFVKPGHGNKPFVLSCCRNLLLFRDDESTFLCNYVTQKLIILPYITNHENEGGVGFGYVPSTKEFKILADASIYGYGYKILTLGTRRWRNVKDPPFGGRNKKAHRLGGLGYGTALVNGNIHFQTFEGKGDKIASFNLEREEWGVVAAPGNYNTSHHYLQELSGYLCMLDHRTYYSNDFMDIWLLKDYNKGSWVKEYTICISTTLKAEHPRMVAPLVIEDDGRLLLQVDRYSLQIYNPKTNRSREIHRFERLEDTRCFYSKCFSSLGHRDIDIAPTNNDISPVAESLSSRIKQVDKNGRTIGYSGLLRGFLL